MTLYANDTLDEPVIVAENDPRLAFLGSHWAPGADGGVELHLRTRTECPCFCAAHGRTHVPAEVHTTRLTCWEWAQAADAAMADLLERGDLTIDEAGHLRELNEAMTIYGDHRCRGAFCRWTGPDTALPQHAGRAA